MDDFMDDVLNELRERNAAQMINRGRHDEREKIDDPGKVQETNRSGEGIDRGIADTERNADAGED